MWSARGRGHGGVVLSRSRPRPRAPPSLATHTSTSRASTSVRSFPALFLGCFLEARARRARRRARSRTPYGAASSAPTSTSSMPSRDALASATDHLVVAEYDDTANVDDEPPQPPAVAPLDKAELAREDTEYFIARASARPNMANNFGSMRAIGGANSKKVLRKARRPGFHELTFKAPFSRRRGL